MYTEHEICGSTQTWESVLCVHIYIYTYVYMVCWSVLEVCWSVLQRVAVCCNVSQCVAVQYTSVNCSLQDSFPYNAWMHGVAVCCSVSPSNTPVSTAHYKMTFQLTHGLIELQIQSLQRVIVCCSVVSLTLWVFTHGLIELQIQSLQRVIACCSVVSLTCLHLNSYRCSHNCCSALQCAAVFCNSLLFIQHMDAWSCSHSCCSVLQCCFIVSWDSIPFHMG